MSKCCSHGTFPHFSLQSSHLNICYYHQDLHRGPIHPSSRPRFLNDPRVLLLIGARQLLRRSSIGCALQRHPFSGLVDSADERFARQYRYEPPPEFPLASPCSGIVHHLSGPNRCARTRTLRISSRSVDDAPPQERGSRPSASLRLAGFQTRRLAHMLDSLVRVSRRVEWKARQPTPRARRCTRPATRAHASFLDHRSGKPTGGNPPALVTMQQPVLVCTSSRAADQPEPFHIRPRRIDSLHPLPSRQFQALFNSLFKVLFIFPSRYLFAIGLSPVFSLGRNLPPN
eukprot:PITA_16797